VDLDDVKSDARIAVRRDRPPLAEGRCVVYWMQRAQRGVDNPALDVAVAAANELKKPVVVFFAPIPFYPHGNARHYAFLAQGIEDIAEELGARRIGFVLRRWPDHRLLSFCQQVRPALIIGDENPLREPAQWRDAVASKVADKLGLAFWTVDADVIVPSKLIDKSQYAARVIRPKLAMQLPTWVREPQNLSAAVPWKRPSDLLSLPPSIRFDELTEGWPLDRSVQPVAGFRGGTREGMRLLREFVSRKLARYSRDRNHPEIEGTSRLSPYLHFGHISPVRAALEVQRCDAPEPEKQAFLDQLITWRELAVNFVRCDQHYDSFDCAEPWAKRTLDAHAKDERPYLYSERQLENAETHDDLWNAAQRQMVAEGWMHNYMRMYWAKKILEWTPSPDAAYEIAVRVNDKYFLDGRDPNGYAGVAWAIAGKFDRPWFDRPIFGRIRYMTGASAARKFDCGSYIRRHGATAV
jgi:deoxyribodipyrimidine photo-lyase